MCVYPYTHKIQADLRKRSTNNTNVAQKNLQNNRKIKMQ